MFVRFKGKGETAVNQYARIFVGAMALSVSGLVAAAGEAPPPNVVDLDALKLKRGTAPVGGAVAPAPTTSLPAVQRGGLLPGGTTAAQPAAAQAAPTTTSTAAKTNEQGIGNVVQTPLRNRATDLVQPKQDDKAAQNSNDVQVKMPSLFRRP